MNTSIINVGVVYNGVSFRVQKIDGGFKISSLNRTVIIEDFNLPTDVKSIEDFMLGYAYAIL